MKPILFNTEMTRAILEGRKTVTRRPVKFGRGQNPAWSGYVPDGGVLYGSNNIPAVKAPYQPGDILWVRETWHKDVGRYMYKANYSDKEKFYRGGKEVSIKWHPSIHMPKKAARLFLRVTGVRVERLWDITEDGKTAEGMRPGWQHYNFYELWDSTIKPADLPICGWAVNPWVWVIEFERVSHPPEGEEDK